MQNQDIAQSYPLMHWEDLTQALPAPPCASRTTLSVLSAKPLPSLWTKRQGGSLDIRSSILLLDVNQKRIPRAFARGIFLVDLTQSTTAPSLTLFATLSHFPLQLKLRKMSKEDQTPDCQSGTLPPVLETQPMKDLLLTILFQKAMSSSFLYTRTHSPGLLPSPILIALGKFFSVRISLPY